MKDKLNPAYEGSYISHKAWTALQRLLQKYMEETMVTETELVIAVIEGT